MVPCAFAHPTSLFFSVLPPCAMISRSPSSIEELSVHCWVTGLDKVRAGFLNHATRPQHPRSVWQNKANSTRLERGHSFWQNKANSRRRDGSRHFGETKP